MMKNVLKTMAAVMLLVGCHKETTGGRATVRVNVNDFSISQQDFPGAKTSPASYSGVKAMTLAFFDANGTVYSTRTVENVPLQRNKVTALTGPLYTNASGASFTLSTAWIGDTNRVNF